MKKVAIAEGLTGLNDYFHKRGYTVLPPDEAEKTVALVVSGATLDFTGVQKRALKVPVINAEGQTPEQIFQQVERVSKAADAEPRLI
ncbi:MAG: YkuS family protein [Candidatus Desulforudis sp.]|nr:YkuS family protein [Desulforudis sp.]